MKHWKRLAGYIPQSFCDWPGKVSAVLFLAGCNLRCPTCHNASIAFQNPQTVDKNKVIANLAHNQKKGWIENVVITGGETCLSDDIFLIAKEMGEMGFKVKIDSNGIKPQRIKSLMAQDHIELFAVDVKAPWAKYPEATGYKVSSVEAQDSLNQVFTMAKNNHKRFLFRTTRVPILTDQDMNIISSYLPAGFNLKVQKYQAVA